MQRDLTARLGSGNAPSGNVARELKAVRKSEKEEDRRKAEAKASSEAGAGTDADATLSPDDAPDT